MDVDIDAPDAPTGADSILTGSTAARVHSLGARIVRPFSWDDHARFVISIFRKIKT